MQIRPPWLWWWSCRGLLGDKTIDPLMEVSRRTAPRGGFISVPLPGWGPTLASPRSLLVPYNADVCSGFQCIHSF